MKFTGDNGESMEIDLVGRCHPHSDNSWDANWLEADIKIDVDGFKAFYAANFRVDDLQRFYESLVKLVNLTTKEAEFTTIEDGLYLLCSSNSRGQVVCSGKARYHQNILDFELQTDIPTVNNWIVGFKKQLERGL